MSAVKEQMVFPTQREWNAMVPIEKFDTAARLVSEARQRRHSDAKRLLSGNEQQALRLLTIALKDLGYEYRPARSGEWTRIP